ncbi:MAG: leucine--tRNA ligase [Patescibacteria group bacterium]|jgi:leucyl-tRNA synthetase
MEHKYIPQEFESKLIEQWEKDGVYKTSDLRPSALDLKNNKNKMYCLSMFPYPSGAGLHVGHVRIYTGTDVLARYFRMKGFSVLHPMGWDAFGLPAENAAIKAKKNPMDMVPANIANFKRQMQMLGLSYDWEKEFATTDPAYYGKTQELFLLFFKLGLLFKKEISVYFCPTCKTGLAEEEVLPNGTHERCGSTISKRDLPQWIFKITTYANSLLDSLKDLQWPNGIVEMQRNWIGKKEGINIAYEVRGSDDKITCFTTRPDTNFGATFIVLAPEHPFAKKVVEKKLVTTEAIHKKVSLYIQKALSKTDLDRIAEGRKKTGVFSGFYAVNNLNGKPLPIWISDFVLGDFGTGAVVGVPGHDRRDFEFAQEFGIEVMRVVKGSDADTSPITDIRQVQEESGIMINSDFLDGLDIMKAKDKMMDHLEARGWGKRVVSFHLRDWIFSRQRYWGEPIPLVYCEKCATEKNSWFTTAEGKSFQKKYQNTTKLDQSTLEKSYGWYPINEGTLPLELPYMSHYEPTENGESPLVQAGEKWLETPCPACGSTARRETDTMPNWAGSCWYFLKFAQNGQVRRGEVASPGDLVEKWKAELKGAEMLPVDWYLGGAEHAVLHLLYARFWVHVLNDLGILGFREPFLRLRNVGMVLATDHRKMSKSLGNVINPDDVVKEYGADTLRVYEMFMAPFNMEIAWSTQALQGSARFLRRIYQIFNNPAKIANAVDDEDVKVVSELQMSISKIESDITNVKFNTAIATLMKLLNVWELGGKIQKQHATVFVQLLAPFAPFIAEDLWRNTLKMAGSVHLSTFPVPDAKQINKSDVTVAVQINGKFRGTVVTKSMDITEKSIIQAALAQESIQKHVAGNYKTIYVPGKIINFIVKGS